MKASNKQKSIPEATVVFQYFWFTKMEKLEWTWTNWKWLNVKVYE